jgi:hypothetical protein
MKKYLLFYILFGISAICLTFSCIFKEDNDSAPNYKGTKCLFISNKGADTILTAANIAADTSLLKADYVIVAKLLSWGVDTIKVVGTGDFQWVDDVSSYLAGYDFIVFSETSVSDEAPALFRHPLPLLNLEAWGAAKETLLWSKHPKAVKNYPVMPSRIVANAPKELRGGLAPGKDFFLTTGVDSIELVSVIGFIPTIQHIPVAVLSVDTLVQNLVNTTKDLGNVDTLLQMPTHLTSACAVEKGVVLADDTTTTLNRAFTIGVFAGAYYGLTPEAWALIKAGLEWILEK